MKGIVTKYLNKRIQSPSVNAEKLHPFKPGDEVEIIEILNGDEIDGNSVWYKLSSGIYVWSGGIKGAQDIPKLNNGETLFQPAQDNFDVKINYNEGFEQIPFNLRSNKGRNIKVAILDSGINLKHDAFTDKNIETYNCNSGYDDVLDNTGHGTHCSGIICGNGLSLKGIAPDSELFVSKIVTQKVNNYSKANFIKGLQWAIHTIDADVINLSFSINKISEDKTILKLLKEASEAGITVIASAGENTILTLDEFAYPGMFDTTIAVGAVNQAFINRNPSFSNALNFLMPNNKILSASKNNSDLVENYGSSMATAFVSGITCLIKSELGPRIDNKVVLQELNHIAKKINNQTNLNNNLQLFTI